MIAPERKLYLVAHVEAKDVKDAEKASMAFNRNRTVGTELETAIGYDEARRIAASMIAENGGGKAIIFLMHSYVEPTPATKVHIV